MKKEYFYKHIISCVQLKNLNSKIDPMKKAILFYVIILLFSCSQSGKNKTSENNSKVPDTKTTPVKEPDSEKVEEITKFNILDKPTYDLSKLDYDGKIVNKKKWQDSNGENIVLFTQNENELFVYHYAINADNVKLMRKVNDFEKACEYDLVLNFIENSIKVTDIDNNNFGEVTFAYKKACISDVSPKNLKLLMLENGNKYIIRGSTSIDMPGYKIDGSKKVDSSFNGAPANFLSHANEIWSKISKE